jgi:hypothetical protein
MTLQWSTSVPTRKLQAKWKSFRLALAKRSLESKLATVLRSAQGHESNGTRNGDRQYILLRDQAEGMCTRFADRWEIDLDLLKAHIPGLYKLQTLAQPTSERPIYRIALVLIIGTPVLFFLMGALTGLVSVGFRLVGGGR